MSFVWDVPPDEAFVELAEAYETAVHAGVAAIAKRYAPEIENWMKSNAPWTDRTGNARQTLHTEVEEVVNEMISLVLSHGVEYGKYLELSHGGRFAIIGPALDYFAPKMWADVQGLFK